MFCAGSGQRRRVTSVPWSGLGLLFGGDLLLVSILSAPPIRISGSLGSVVALAAVPAAIVAFRFGLRRVAAGSSRLLDRDARKRILWLRSFHDDDIRVRWPFCEFGLRLPFVPGRFEEAVAQSVFEWGAVIAIGRPGEAAPRLGAIRRYVSDDVWQTEAEGLIANAGAILLVLGRTEGLGWELGRIVHHRALPRTLILCPPVSPEELSCRWRIMLRIFQSLSVDVPTQLPEKPLLIAFDDHGSAKVVCASRASRAFPGWPPSCGPYRGALGDAIGNIRTVKRVKRDIPELEFDDDEPDRECPPVDSPVDIEALIEAAWQGAKSGIHRATQRVVHSGVGGAFEYFRRPASVKRRLLALFIDYLFLSVPLAALRSAVVGEWPRFETDGTWAWLAGLYWIMALIAYFAGFESSPWRGTPGKRLLRIEVSDLADKRIDYLQAIVRNLLKPISVLGLLAMSRAPRKQGLHDIDIAGQTLVVAAR